MRRFYTGLAIAAFAGASLQAPFAHLHPEDPDHHHAKGFSHTHLAVHEHHHEAEGPEMEAHDDEEFAIFLEWTPTAEQRISLTYVEGPPVLTVEPALVRVGSAPEFRPRAHSPPAVRLLPARAPPL